MNTFSISLVRYMDVLGSLGWSNQVLVPDNSCGLSLCEASIEGAGLWTCEHT
jgi:hypothetical protein